MDARANSVHQEVGNYPGQLTCTVFRYALHEKELWDAPTRNKSDKVLKHLHCFNRIFLVYQFRQLFEQHALIADTCFHK